MSQFPIEMYLLLSLPAFFVGLSRGGLGGGFALAAAIFSAQIFEPIKAAAFLLPLLIISDPLSIWIYRKNIYWNSIKILLPGVILGVVLTFFLINKISSSIIGIIVGFLGVFLAIDGLTRKFVKTPKKILHPTVGVFLGAIGGFSSFIIHSGLPPIAAYLLPLKLTRQKFMGTVAVIFAITNIIKLFPYFLLGLFDKELIKLTLTFIPITFLGIFVGKFINNKISDQVFFFIIYTSVFFLGLRLIWFSF